jgi:serine/threonine protein kinase
VLHNFPSPMVHRDLKLANVLVASRRAYVGDLGLAKVQSINSTVY